MRYGNLRNRLLAVRRSRGISQIEAAAEIGCSIRAFKKWESGLIDPLTIWAERLARFFSNSPAQGVLEEPAHQGSGNKARTANKVQQVVVPNGHGRGRHSSPHATIVAGGRSASTESVVKAGRK